MDKIKKFKEFIDRSNLEIQKIHEKGKEIAKEVIEDFFSEEIKIISDIHDMIVDWEDEGIHFVFDVSIKNIHGGGRNDLGRHQKINLSEILLKSFGPQDLLEFIPSWQNSGHKLIISISTISKNKELSKSCSVYLSKRIKLAYPQLSTESVDLKDTFSSTYTIIKF